VKNSRCRTEALTLFLFSYHPICEEAESPRNHAGAASGQGRIAEAAQCGPAHDAEAREQLFRADEHAMEPGALVVTVGSTECAGC